MPPSPRVTVLTPPGAALDEDALARHEPLMGAIRARFSRFATGPLARRHPAMPRLAASPGVPRVRWRLPSGPFTRSPVMKSPAIGSPPSAPLGRAPSPAPRDAIATWRPGTFPRLPVLRRKQRP